MAENKGIDEIDRRLIFKKIWERKMLFAKVLPVVFVLSCLYIICIPRTYITTCKLAPEMNSTVGGGTLGSLASSFGIDLSEMNTTDAITPMLYPDLMEDNKFVVELFPVLVEKSDGSLQTTYKDYLSHHQKFPFWAYVLAWVKELLPKADKAESIGAEITPSPYILSKDDDDLCQAIRSNIQFGMDRKTGVITITVSDQDALICKTMADSVSTHLQQYITEYRTNKARVDLEFYRKLTNDVKAEYDSLRRKYNILVDANQGVILQRVKSKLEDMESEMSLHYQTYTTLNTMLQQAVSKVQENTPAFTVLKGAEMPLKPAKPKRMIFVLVMVMLAGACVSVYILRDILKP